MRQFIWFILIFTLSRSCHANRVGRFVNPITDLCWSCLFPMTIGPFAVNPGGGLSDTENAGSTKNIVCFCPKPPLPVVAGIPVGFWEPARLMDVTRIPFNFVSLGFQIAGMSNYGPHHLVKDARTGRETGFYHVHYYVYPIMYWMELFLDFLCLELGSFDVGYVTELDPMWSDDEMSFLINPEAGLFGNNLAQLACGADCMSTSGGKATDKTTWCSGCQGSLYPFTGNVSNHIGGVQSSLLLAGRMLAKLHRELLLWETSGPRALCQKRPLPIIKKSQYRLQMTYPIPATKKELGCHPIGRNSFLLESGREYPRYGEDFGYIIWRKVNCCLL